MRTQSVSRFVVLCLGLGIAGIPANAQSPSHLLSFSQVTAATPLSNGIELHDGALVMRITALRDDVLRIRAGRNNALPEDASWAVLPEARSASATVTQDTGTATIGFHTGSLRIAMDRATGLLTLS